MESTPFGTSPLNRVTDIAWLEWDDDLFEDRATADQLRLLLVAPRAHRDLDALARGSLADPRLARLIPRAVTPIRVEPDLRPDLALRYGDPNGATLALLSPGGELLAQFRDTSSGELVEVIETWLARWRDERDAVLAELEAERVLRLATRPIRRGDLSPSVLDIALDRAATAEDLAGPERIRLWLYAHRRRADLESERRARVAIQRRVDGGGFDREAGGFRRCVDPGADCAERPAADQGRWLSVLARIASEDSEAHEWALEAVTRTIEFVEAELRNSSGGFAYSAESDQVLASANALLARGLLACGVVFDRSDWRSRGQTGVDFLIRRMRAGEAGFYHVWDGVPRTLGLLADQVLTGQALLDTYEATGSVDYLHHAQTVARLLSRQFQISDGPLADIDLGQRGYGQLEEPRVSLFDNAEAAELLIRLTHLTHDDRYMDTAYSILRGAVAAFGSADLESACAVARVVDRLLSLEPEVKIIAFAPPGERDAIADPLHAQALRLALSAHTVQRLNPRFDDVLVGQLGVPADIGGALCFVGGEYGPLVTRPDELLPAIERAVSAS